ncbi:hypothetical protein AAY473_016023 [Plecturocebus cupreus]
MGHIPRQQAILIIHQKVARQLSLTRIAQGDLSRDVAVSAAIPKTATEYAIFHNILLSFAKVGKCPAPAVAKRGQCTAQAVASESVSPKPWQLPCGVEHAGAQKSRTEVWELLPRFQKMCGNTWMLRQKFAASTGTSWRTSARAVQKENVGSQHPHRVSTGALPSGAMRRGPLSSRPQNGRSTGSLQHLPGKATDIQHQPMKATRREAIPCKAIGAELPKTMGTHLLHPCDLDMRPGVKGGHFGALKFDCPVNNVNSHGHW